MNKKLLSIACIALTLCMFSTPFAADAEFTIFGRPLGPVLLTNSAEITIQPNHKLITVISISKSGVSTKEGCFSKTDNASDCVLTFFSENQPTLVSGSFDSTSTSVSLSGSIVGKQKIDLSAGVFKLEQLTVFGTNGKCTLVFTDPNSLIKSLTMEPSNITTTYNGEELNIGSVWGDFTGAPTSNEQNIYLVGYPKISVHTNPVALANLVKKQ